MTGHYIPRSLASVLARALTEFPVVVLIGPRQSGKTALLKHMVGSQWPVISLEPPDVRAAASATHFAVYSPIERPGAGPRPALSSVQPPQRR